MLLNSSRNLFQEEFSSQPSAGSTCDNSVKINKITQTNIFFSTPKIIMEAALRDIASSEAGLATDMRVEEDEASVDGKRVQKSRINGVSRESKINVLCLMMSC